MATKVLIAHGNTQRLKRAVTDLQARGFEVAATPDGGDAFARFFEEDPDIVICSDGLPGLSGVNFARMVHSQAPHTGVVLLVENEGGEGTQGLDVMREPLDVEQLCAHFPELAPARPAPAAESGDAIPPPTAAEVFVLSALKRFQRGSNLLALLDEPGILSMARMATQRTCADAEQVLRQGDAGDSFYLVVEGQVRVTLREQGDTEVARIGEGGFFGEMALLGDVVRSASVWSVGRTTLLRFGRDDFLPLLGTYPSLREMLSGVALERSEENLWSVLLADDEVQRSLGDLSAVAQGATASAGAEAGPSLGGAERAAGSDAAAARAALADDATPARGTVAPHIEVGRGRDAPRSGPSPDGFRDVKTGEIARPDVPRRSAGAPAADDIDLLDAAAMDLRSAGELAPGAPDDERASRARDTEVRVVLPAPGTSAAQAAAEPATESAGGTHRAPATAAGTGARRSRRTLVIAAAAGLAAVVLIGGLLATRGGGDAPSSGAPAVARSAATQSPGPGAAAVARSSAPTSSEDDGDASPTASSGSAPSAAGVAGPGAGAKAPAAKADTVPSTRGTAAAPSTKLPDSDRKELRRQLFALSRAKSWAAAAEVGRKVRPALVNDWEAELVVADAERNAGALDDALAAYRAFMQKYPTNVHVDEAQFWAAELLVGAGKTTEAKELLQKVLANPRTKFRTSAEGRLKQL